MIESVTAVRYVNSEILREGLGARICERTPDSWPLSRPQIDTVYSLPIWLLYHLFTISDRGYFTSSIIKLPSSPIR
ncbi:TPA: hypothetical protein MIH59_10050 [Klebsiella pneumoniae]|nr:hypothetical protein [Klebsiella pneumoniae]